jgi:hypothetical protein
VVTSERPEGRGIQRYPVKQSGFVDTDDEEPQAPDAVVLPMLAGMINR